MVGILHMKQAWVGANSAQIIPIITACNVTQQIPLNAFFATMDSISIAVKHALNALKMDAVDVQMLLSAWIAIKLSFIIQQRKLALSAKCLQVTLGPMSCKIIDALSAMDLRLLKPKFASIVI